MSRGPFGGPRPFAKSDTKVFLTTRVRREGLSPTELELQRGFANIRGPTVDDIDIRVEELDDGDILLSDELTSGIEVGVEQMQAVRESLENMFSGAEVKSVFVQVV